MDIQLKQTVAAPADRVWAILGPEYPKVGNWASEVYASKPRPGTPLVAGAPVAGRVCETSLGPFTETIETYDPDTRTIAYSATGDAMPGFMRGLRNQWVVRPDGASRCKVETRLTADIAQPFAFLMGWMMKRKFQSAMTTSMNDLKTFAETGRVSAAKTDADRKPAARQAKAEYASHPAA